MGIGSSDPLRAVRLYFIAGTRADSLPRLGKNKHVKPAPCPFNSGFIANSYWKKMCLPKSISQRAAAADDYSTTPLLSSTCRPASLSKHALACIVLQRPNEDPAPVFPYAAIPIVCTPPRRRLQLPLQQETVSASIIGGQAKSASFICGCVGVLSPLMQPYDLWIPCLVQCDTCVARLLHHIHASWVTIYVFPLQNYFYWIIA
jgi:hypothetical protein